MRSPDRPVTLSSELIVRVEDLQELYGPWDDLAVANRLPAMSPAFVVAWWRRMAGTGNELSVVALKEGERLLGIAPLYLSRRRRPKRRELRLPGIELAGRLAPLAAPGFERHLADATVACLRADGRNPDLVSLEATPLELGWGELLKRAWPGRVPPLSLRYKTASSPVVPLRAASFEEWLAGKSSNFRGQMRRVRRQFASAGGSLRISTTATLGADVETFMRLHASRWHGRGRSKLLALGEPLLAMVNDLGETLLAQEGRFRMQVLEVKGEPISAQLFLAAGGRVLYVNGGWDERFAELKPAMLAILEAIRESFERGDDELDLGIGAQPYKLRFATEDDPMSWMLLLPVGPRLPLTCVALTPWLALAAARRATSRLQ